MELYLETSLLKGAIKLYDIIRKGLIKSDDYQSEEIIAWILRALPKKPAKWLSG